MRNRLNKRDLDCADRLLLVMDASGCLITELLDWLEKGSRRRCDRIGYGNLFQHGSGEQYVGGGGGNDQR